VLLPENTFKVMLLDKTYLILYFTITWQRRKRFHFVT